MKKITSIIASIFIIPSLFSQVGGISTSKLNTNAPETIGKNALEVEADFTFIGGNKQFDNHRSVETLPENFNDAELGVRMAYGISDKTDVGAYLDEELTILNLSGRYHFLDHEKFNVGTIAGFNVPLREAFKAHSLHDEDNTTAYVIGLTSSYYFSDCLSIDSDFQIQNYFKHLDNHHKEDIFINTDVGFQASEKWLIMTGVNYVFSHYTESIDNSENLTINPGVAFFPSNTIFNCTINFPFSVYGKNSEKQNGVQFAWTFAF